MPRVDETEQVDVTCVRRSGAAWLVVDGDGTEAWLPLNQVDFPDDAKEGATVTVEVPGWLARKAGLA